MKPRKLHWSGSPKAGPWPIRPRRRLERASTQRDPGIFWTKVDPLLRSLHADPRWGVFLRKLGLAE